MDFTCPDCGGKMIPFYPDDDKRISAIPYYCELCNKLRIGNTEFTMSGDQHLKTVADQAQEVVSKALEDIKEDPEFQVRYYFERVFSWAFAEGFMRAFAHFKHRFKEGRMRRIRELWNRGKENESLSLEEIDELDKLVNMGFHDKVTENG